MLNEERVKHMVKLAFYEATDGKEELKAGSYYKKDYINYHVLWSVLWLTIAYTILLVLLAITYISVLAEQASALTITLIACAALVIYIALLITYITVTRKIYKKKHARAYHRVKKFRQDLVELEMLYKKEELNGEII